MSTLREPNVDGLIDELRTNRSELHGMIDDIVDFRKKMNTLLPPSDDFKNRFKNEERMKTITAIIASELSIRKQIDDSAQFEINLRRKIEDDETGSSAQDIRNMAKALEMTMKKETET